ncbi:MAG: hypothetical protein ACOYJ6_09410 [Caulobacterales bacterium]|jgi:hypothetical protein
MKRIRDKVQSMAATAVAQHDLLMAQLRVIFSALDEDHLSQIATGAVLMAMTLSGSVRQVYLDVMALGVQATDALNAPN